jgi:hypothetical protein
MMDGAIPCGAKREVIYRNLIAHLQFWELILIPSRMSSTNSHLYRLDSSIAIRGVIAYVIIEILLSSHLQVIAKFEDEIHRLASFPPRNPMISTTKGSGDSREEWSYFVTQLLK